VPASWKEIGPVPAGATIAAISHSCRLQARQLYRSFFVVGWQGADDTEGAALRAQVENARAVLGRVPEALIVAGDER
jgi:hypothetical protein